MRADELRQNLSPELDDRRVSGRMRDQADQVLYGQDGLLSPNLDLEAPRDEAFEKEVASEPGRLPARRRELGRLERVREQPAEDPPANAIVTASRVCSTSMRWSATAWRRSGTVAGSMEGIEPRTKGRAKSSRRPKVTFSAKAETRERLMVAQPGAAPPRSRRAARTLAKSKLLLCSRRSFIV